jgi:glycosyltransferase involved in cell wall biosynthesis
MMAKTLVYIDPGYSTNFGHYTRMRKLIREEAAASNVALHHYVNLDVPVEEADALGLIRRFKHKAALQWIEEPAESLRDFHEKLNDILHDLSTKGPSGEYEFFMYTSHLLHLPIIAYLLNKYHAALPGLSAHVCLFYIDPEFCLGVDGAEECKSMLTRVSRLIELCDPRHIMIVCADSERTAQLYGPYFTRPLRLLSLPVESASSIAMKRKAEVNGSMTIGYIGQTTSRAGYDLVYHAYKRFSTMEAFNKVKFNIKHTRREALSQIHSLFLSESRNITHIDEFLSNEAYEEFISDCDIILLPYSRQYYPCQTSGVVVEALCRNKVVIVPEDTWMSDQIRDYGSGETFVSDGLESLVQAVVKVITNFEYYNERTNRNITEYRNLHSCSNLFLELGLKETGVKVESHTAPITMDSSTGLLEERMIESVLLMCEKDELIRRKNREIRKRDAVIKKRDDEIQAMRASRSWKITAPLRRIDKVINPKSNKETRKKSF